MAFTLAASLVSQAGPAAITVDLARPAHRVPDTLWGIFFEEINHAGEGGLYGELVQNRDLEAAILPEGWRAEGQNVFTPRGWRADRWFTNDLPGWSLVTEGGAQGEITLESGSPLNDRNPHSLRLTVRNPGRRCGVANDGFWGMNFQAGEWYDLAFYARTETNAHLRPVVSLENQGGVTISEPATLPEVSGDWKNYSLAFQARRSDPKGRLVIALPEAGTIWLDVVSLFPRKTFKDRPNGLRADVARLLADLHPAFLRFPGGCVVEGCTLQNRFRWKDSIGDISRRKGGYDLWGYYNTYGLGFHEYLQLAEDLGAESIYVINAGMSCQSRGTGDLVEDSGLDEYVQDSLDALEYATGPATSQWGAQRAANGHPEPFRIHYVEIGNENSDPDYERHYKVLRDAIKARYPQVVIIATVRMPNEPVEFVDDHFYAYPTRFLRMLESYDGADRHGPSVYVGEYAASRGVGRGNLLGALAEAVFMLDLEKNSDLVKLCSYAPLLGTIRQPNSGSSLILMDNSRCVGRSSYQVQKLFSANRPDYVLDTEVRASKASITMKAPRITVTNSGIQQLFALGGLDEKCGEVVVKVVNPTAAPVPALVAIKGALPAPVRMRITTLGNADAGVENTLEHPDTVMPVESELDVSGAQFSYRFTPNSLTILRLPIPARARAGPERD